LLPVQGDYQREADFDSQAVSLNYVLDQFRGSRAAGLVILDACRDNPFRSSTRSATRGLGRKEPPDGLLIAYSTAENQTAADGSGTNGLYTKHLAHFLSQKGLAVDEVFDQTAKQVKLESRGVQSPREDSDIRDKLYLNGTPQIAAAPAPAPVAGDDGLEAQTWRDAQSVGTTAVYRAFIEGFPQSRYTAAARIKLAAAEQRERKEAAEAEAAAAASLLRERAQTEAKAWQEAQAADTVEDYQAFIETYPQSPNLKAAQRKLAAAEKAEAADEAKRVAEAWRSAQQADTVESYEAFLNAHGSSSFVSAAKQKLEAARARQPKWKVGDTFRDCAECPEMVVLPAGSFEMGDLHGDGDTDEKPVRTVRIGQAFAMGRYEVTQGQWKAVMGGNPSKFSKCGDNCPVEKVSWDEVQVFISKLNAKTGKRYRLPSEAEWEYACRAGKRHRYCGSDSVDDVAWYDRNSDRKTYPVGGKSANGWGSYDMAGNVMEWVQDYYEENGYNKGQPLDDRAHAPSSNDGALRVVRGGSWFNLASNARSATRTGASPDYFRSGYVGFRLSRTLP
jgi:formylglycine-generating enzyme required for sulfatase activity